MIIWREWCSKLHTRCGNMIPDTVLQNIIKSLPDTGYSSIYGFAEEDAIEIRKSGKSRGFDRFDAIGDSLLIDLDDGGVSLPEVEDKIHGHKYDVFTSGGKGLHVVLYHTQIKSKDLPYSHKVWVEGRGITCDLSLYQAGRIVSLPGRVHPKTKKRKSLIKQVDGDLIQITLTPRPEPLQFCFKEETFNAMQVALMNLLNMATYEPVPGNRHTTIWGVTRDLLRAGFPLEAVEAFILKVNDIWIHKKDPDDVIKAVRQATKI